MRVYTNIEKFFEAGQDFKSIELTKSGFINFFIKIIFYTILFMKF